MSLYLDHNATTGLLAAAREAMLPWLDGACGNPSSVHSAGQRARRALDQGRTEVARLIGADPDEIVFTSGGTEANNLAILGAARALNQDSPRLLIGSTEHQAVLNPAQAAARAGAELRFAPVDAEGVVDEAAVRAALSDGVSLLSIMTANNDTGTVQPVAALARQARERGAISHSDAVQAAGKMPLNVVELGVDLLSLSSHKLGGPQGLGALFVRRGVRLTPLTFGGHQERGLRPGTENVAGIVGFGVAARLAREQLAAAAKHLAALRDAFETHVVAAVAGVVVNGGGATRLCNTSNLRFPGLDGDALVINLDLMGLAASTGAACSSLDREPSHVLLAMGQTPAEARASVRFSFGRGHTEEDARRAAELVCRAVAQMRSGPP